MALPNSDDGKGVVLIYATCPDKETALAIARSCVAGRYAACANILDGMTAVFAWEGEIQTAPEVSLILKSTEARAKAAREHVVALHPYDVPAVMVVPVAGGHAPFLDWIGDSVGGPATADQRG